MRHDLLEAKASIDWAVSNFPSLQGRLSEWLNLNVSLEIKELESSKTDNLIVAIEKEALPLSFNAEVGAYINSIRSGLDVLACVVASRHGISKLDNMYFPIVRSATIFASGTFNGSEFIQCLPPAWSAP
jgi:hypothetical protein